MSSIFAKLAPCVFAGGIALTASTSAMAQSFDTAGIIRVSDSVPATSTPAGTPISGYCPNGGSISGQIVYTGYPGDGTVNKHGGYRFMPPVKRPIYRTPVSYQKGYPDAWTGQGVYGQVPAYQAPTVYMPTDTTQLGYYYQAVPYWQPRPGMIPQPPIPSQWHTTVGQMQYYGHHPAGIIYGTAPTAVPHTPAPAPWDSKGLPPEPTPVNSTYVPPGPVSVEANIATPVGLERTSDSPNLLPIE
jgi:hypothetical protein